ncbi:secretin N-terminal domain-containing protein [Prosthecobacter vanneervenii]|uniref:Type II secretion system protein D n=1 Tax=Prosthecobacter vanneervenii TaxID=48466 RepID=A0A7W8DMA4_9BACT|nr:secretin N-terminal domain-containing protein [Prosthecobacter vanneervenii]MBB5035209.1 type II secretion system protein D [Prosthecobacter vanneervenii]
MKHPAPTVLLMLLLTLPAAYAQVPERLPGIPPQPGRPISPPVGRPPGPPAGGPAVLPPAANPAAVPGAPAAPAPAAADDGGDGNVISFTATPVAEVLAEYFRVTGRKVLRDRGLENAVVTIEVPGKFTNDEYRSIIEKGLLMHGYVLVPSGPDLYKLVAAELGSMPSAQNVPIIMRSEDLPDTDQVVTHVLQLNFISAEDASSAFQTIIPLHPYGKILAVPNSQALVITEASQTIRAFVELAKQVDQPPVETVQKTFRIERAEADEVIEQLGTLMGLDAKGSSGGGGGGAPRAPAPGGAPGATPGAAASAPSSASISGAAGSGKPIMQAVSRTNSIIVVARPLDMKKIEALIKELDAEPTASRYFSRKLNYLDLTTFLSIAEKALMRNDPKAQGSSLDSLQKSQPNSTQSTNNNTGFGSGSTMGSGLGTGGIGGLNSGMGGLGSSGLGGGMGMGSSSVSSDLAITKKPISILIANTLVIADPGTSKFFASGPPDQVKALEELAEELDVRPRQILLSTIIGTFTLGDNFNFGLDWIQTLKQVGNDGLVGGVLNTQGTAFANPANLKDISGFLATGGPAALSGLTAYGQINKNLNVFLQTLESTKRFQVMQKPTLTTLNHQPAQIYIGQQVAIAGQSYTSGVVGGGFTSTTQYIPVRLQLIITPHIYNDNEVMLEFKQQNNDISGYTTISGNQVPNISEQGLNNNLIVADQATAMLGGLITERDTDNKSGLPFLVRIPLIKHLVGSTNKIKQRNEMMIFVQPRILPDNAALMLEQERLGDASANYDRTASFGSMPEMPVPKAVPANEGKPNDILPPPGQPEPKPEAKKGLLNKMKGWFQKSKPE